VQWAADQRQAILCRLARLLQQHLAGRGAQPDEEDAHDGARAGR
jgi:hypothetical protein